MPRVWELCRDGKLAEVRSALARGDDVNSKNSYGITALMHAVENKQNSIVKLLLDQPAVDVNLKDNVFSRTALHWAASGNNVAGARMLLLHKDISVNVTDNDGNTALMIAVIYRKEEVLRELVEHQCVSLDVGYLEGDQSNATILSIVDDARTRRAQASVAANSRQGRSHIGEDLAQRLHLSDNRCESELEELRKQQSERVQRVLQQHEEKEQKLVVDNQKREKEAEENLLRMKRENKEKVEALKLENERTLATMMEENERQEALMVAKHEGEKALKKAAELEAKRIGVEARRPQIPACPVCLEEMVPPTRIFQCGNGHLVCETCKNGLRPCICPECRQDIIGRATAMEALLRSLQ